jgi:hypothetical protein
MDNVARGTSKRRTFGKMLGKNERHHWNKKPKLKGAAMSRKQEDIQQDLQQGSRAGDHEAKSPDFSQDLKNECPDIVMGSVPSETKEETAQHIDSHKCRSTDHSALSKRRNGGMLKEEAMWCIDLLLGKYFKRKKTRHQLLLCNGVIKDTSTATELLLETEFSTRSMQRGYKEDNWCDPVS